MDQSAFDALGDVQAAALPTRPPNTRVFMLGRYLQICQRTGGWQAGPRKNTCPARTGSSVETSAERSMRRACSQVQKLILAYDLGWLLTVTFAAEVSDPRAAWRQLANFIRRARHARGAFPWVAVAAVQHERALRTGVSVWHFHLAVGEGWPQAALDELWGQGRADCRPLVDEHGELQPLQLANYLRRNLRSTMGEQVSGRRYRSARGMPIERVEAVISEADLDQYLRETPRIYDVGKAQQEGRTALLRLTPMVQETFDRLISVKEPEWPLDISLHG